MMNIKNIILEEIDDFDWIRDVNFNLFNEDLFLLIDVPIGLDEAKVLFDMLVEAGRTTEEENIKFARYNALSYLTKKGDSYINTYRNTRFSFGGDPNGAVRQSYHGIDKKIIRYSDLYR